MTTWKDYWENFGDGYGLPAPELPPCCDKEATDQTYELRCQISDLISQCAAKYPNFHPDNLDIDVGICLPDSWFPGSQAPCNTIGGFENLLREYLRCQQNNPQGLPLYDDPPAGTNPSCGVGNPKPDKDLPPGCRAWARINRELTNELWEQIKTAQDYMCVQAGINPSLPDEDPVLKLSCRPKFPDTYGPGEVIIGKGPKLDNPGQNDVGKATRNTAPIA